jgi:predicted transcriptional regulator
MRSILNVTLREYQQIAQALSADVRIQILELLEDNPLNVNEIAEKLDLPVSTATVNIKKLEDAGLIRSELQPGIRGSQKICSRAYDKIVLEMDLKDKEEEKNSVYIPMPIGCFVDCHVYPTCGIVTDKGPIGFYDDPRAFYESERINAQLIWFSTGYVDYRFPNNAPYGSIVDTLEFSAEICSEAPLYNENWPSDIFISINDVEIGVWTSPGDFGERRGILTPDWWEDYMTQHGIMKKWKVTTDGTYIDGIKISEVNIEQLNVKDKHYISLRIGVKPTAQNVGGINIFGKKFGNYEQELMLRLDYHYEK